MRTIYKYPLTLGFNGVSLPSSAKIIHIAEQNGQLQMWVEQADCGLLSQRQFNVYGTGHYIYNNNEMHLATVLVGDFVWHVYEAL